MVKEPCPDPRMLLEAVPAGQASSWADHLAGCPRCRALVASRDAFLNDALAAGSYGPLRGDDAAAAVRLDTVIAGLGARKSHPRRPAWWLPLAAVFLVAVGVWSLVPRTNDGNHGNAPVMRGEATAPAWSAPLVSIDGQHTVVSWSPVPGAEGYRLEVLAPDLNPVDSFNAGQETRWQLDAARYPTLKSGGFVVISALKAGQVFARTPLVPLR